MQRSRLKNIISKSKDFSNPIGAFDKFKKSLPIEVDDNYRLEAAWKAYGSPKDYKEALWQGMIQPIDENNVKLPSIGYNEETDEYEYLNKGRENETVNKDIRVWDNDVIPFVKELKQGGFIRTFDEEKDCWKYSKKQETQTEQKEVIEQFQEGGKSKPKFEDWYKTLPKDKSNMDDYDLEKAFNELPFEELEEFRINPNKHLSGDYKKPNHPTYGGYGNWVNKNGQWHYYISPIQIENYPERDFNWYKNYWDTCEPESVLHWIDGSVYRRGITEFKQGGFIRIYDEEKNCWKYSKNKPQETQAEQMEIIEQFQDGGTVQKKYTLPEMFQNRNINGISIKYSNPYLPNSFNSQKDVDDFISKYSKYSSWVINDPNSKYKNLRVQSEVLRDGGSHEVNIYDDDDSEDLWNLGGIIEDNGITSTENDKKLAAERKTKLNDFLKPYGIQFNSSPQTFKQGGQMNVIPEGALHARKNNMDLAKEGEVTHKGIPVVDNEGNQTAEVEKEEWTMTKELTEDVEAWYRKYYDEETSQKEKDELAIKCGKRITKELLHNTDDRANLIAKMLEEEE